MKAMSLQGQKGLIPVASVKMDAWDVIHRYCRGNDVAVGGDYDTPSGGAINVYMAEDWPKPWAGLHGTYYPELSNAFGWVNIFWQTGTYSDESGLMPWESEDTLYSWAENWSAGMAREHFCKLYKQATGKEYSVFFSKFDAPR